jgi:hypothetical protein
MTEGVIIINDIALLESFGNKLGFVAVNSAVSLVLDLLHLFVVNNIMT